MIRFLFDNTVVDPPVNWREIMSSFKRDEKTNTILLSMQAKYEFTGTAYEYIIDLINTSGFCASIEVAIQEQCGDDWVQFMSGNIFISDCEVNERLCNVTTTIQDSSYYAKINNNKSIKTSPDGERSKNNVSITSAQTYNLDVYSFNANTLVKSNTPAIRIYEAMRYMISFVSDGTLSFVSDTFDVGGEWEGLCIISGERLRLNSAVDWVQFNLVDLLKEVNNRIPIVLAVEDNNGAKVVRVESQDYFQQSGIIYNFTDVYEVISTYDTEKLYSHVKFGGETDPSLVYLFPETLPLYGFQEEEFGILGICNIDNELDLTCRWIASNNVIYQIVTNSAQDYDKKIIIIDSILTDATNGRTRNTNFFNLTPARYAYNEGLTNYRTALRYFERIPNGIASYFSPPGTGTFKANIDPTIGTITVFGNFPALPFDQVVYDISGNYDGTDTYTATQLGVYTTNVNIGITVTNPSTGMSFALKIRTFTSGAVFIADYPLDTLWLNSAGNYTLSGSADVILNTGDYMVVRIEMLPGVIPIAFTFDVSSYWEVVQTSLTGGIYETYDPDDLPIRIHEFDYPLSSADHKAIIASPYGYCTFAQNGQLARKGYIKELRYNHVTGMANVKLITDKSNLYAY